MSDKSNVIVLSKSFTVSDYKLLTFNIRQDIFPELGIDNYDTLIYSISTKTPGANYNDYEVLEELKSLDIFINICIQRNVKRSILISSASVYGFGSTVFTEDSPYRPESEYGFLKVKMENRFLNRMSVQSIQHNIFRISNVFGSVTSKQGIINLVLNSKNQNKFVEVYNSGEDIRDFIYEVDLSNLFFSLINSKLSKPIYNISSSIGYKIKDVVDIIINEESSYNRQILIINKKRKVTKSVLSNKSMLDEIGFYEIQELSSSIKELIKLIESS